MCVLCRSGFSFGVVVLFNIFADQLFPLKGSLHDQKNSLTDVKAKQAQ